ncbi:MAG: protein adenylyltransferase SelO family protein, partial [Winogradskyella sp.]
IKFFSAVAERTLNMIIHWQRVGFVHGVMNTDNMSILGLTIDYGPYGWLEDFDFGWTPNTTDKQNKRYRYGNQPNIGLWNLLQLANALYTLVDEAEPFETVLNQYKTDFEIKSLQMMRSKLGLETEDAKDAKLMAGLEDCLIRYETDMTLFFRLLGNYTKGNYENGITIIHDAVYKPEQRKAEILDQWKVWFKTYDQRLERETLSDAQRKAKMNTVNPKYVLRNYMAQLAIDDADKGNYKLLDELFQLLKNPYKEQPEQEKWFAKRPEWARHKVGCSMLSCSS